VGRSAGLARGVMVADEPVEADERAACYAPCFGVLRRAVEAPAGLDLPRGSRGGTMAGRNATGSVDREPTSGYLPAAESATD
jgi:hypothetical protein